MAIPNCKHIVEQLKAEYPSEWNNAHTGNAHTEDFIRRLAWVLHSTVNPNFGLLGQYGDPNRVADDAILYLGEGGGRTPDGRAQTGFDVIASAGSPAAAPAWNQIPAGTGVAAWVQPTPVSDSTPTPQPTPQPPVDLGPLLTELVEINAKQDRLMAMVDALAPSIGQAAHESLQAAIRTSEIKTLIENMPAGKPFPVYTGNTKAFGGSLTLTPKEP